MLGSNLLVAPLFSEGDARMVYLPPGEWIDYQSGQTYAGGQWQSIAAGAVPIVLLVRGGSAIPHCQGRPKHRRHRLGRPGAARVQRERRPGDRPRGAAGG